MFATFINLFYFAHVLALLSYIIDGLVFPFNITSHIERDDEG